MTYTEADHPPGIKEMMELTARLSSCSAITIAEQRGYTTGRKAGLREAAIYLLGGYDPCECVTVESMVRDILLIIKTPMDYSPAHKIELESELDEYDGVI